MSSSTAVNYLTEQGDQKLVGDSRKMLRVEYRQAVEKGQDRGFAAGTRMPA